MTAPGKAVLLERRDQIAIVRLNRPDKRNALDTATLDELNEILAALASDEALRVLVISTTDTIALCAGADISEPLDHEGGVVRMVAFVRFYSLLEQCPVPLIVVAVGNCVGAGAELVAAADLRVGGDNLKLAWPGARLGVPVGPARLAPLIGVAAAKDLVLTGRVVGMTEAQQLGIVQRTAATADAENVALELAAQVARQHPIGTRVIKQLFRDLDSSAQRMAIENERLMHFQQYGAGLPRG